MKVHCRTNLDDYQKCDWPTEMVCRPMTGDYVQSSSGAILRVGCVTHTGASDKPFHAIKASDPPSLIVELNR